MNYPCLIEVDPEFLQELYQCEYGRYEDAMNAREADDEESINGNDYQVVACDFLNRHRTVIEIQNDAELRELYYACASGTIGSRGYAEEANRVLDKIRDTVRNIDPGLVGRWPNQSMEVQ